MSQITFTVSPRMNAFLSSVAVSSTGPEAQHRQHTYILLAPESGAHSSGRLLIRSSNLNSVSKVLAKCHGLSMLTVKRYCTFPCIPWKVDGKSPCGMWQVNGYTCVPRGSLTAPPSRVFSCKTTLLKLKRSIFAEKCLLRRFFPPLPLDQWTFTFPVNPIAMDVILVSFVRSKEIAPVTISPHEKVFLGLTELRFMLKFLNADSNIVAQISPSIGLFKYSLLSPVISWLHKTTEAKAWRILK